MNVVHMNTNPIRNIHAMHRQRELHAQRVALQKSRLCNDQRLLQNAVTRTATSPEVLIAVFVTGFVAERRVHSDKPSARGQLNWPRVLRAVSVLKFIRTLWL